MGGLFLYYVFTLLLCVFQETVDERLFACVFVDGGSREHAEPLESQYPHVKRSLQRGEACCFFFFGFFGANTFISPANAPKGSAPLLDFRVFCQRI